LPTIELNFEQIFENIDDGLLVIKNNSILLTNTQYRRLWGTTKFFQTKGNTFKPYDNEIEVLVQTRSFGHRTIPVNSGSEIRYYYLYLFPLNGDYFVIISRNITEQYLEHTKNREHKTLFKAILETVPVPVALIDSHGRVDRMNPLFFNCLDSSTTLINGSFIWDFFGDDRPKIKELIEELFAEKSLFFEERNFRFIHVKSDTSPWILVYRLANVKGDTGGNIGDSSEIKKILQVFQDFEAFIRVLHWIAALPWKMLIALAVGSTLVFGGVNIEWLLPNVPPNVPAEESPP
jgi:PAS domain S-box-containing protein